MRHLVQDHASERPPRLSGDRAAPQKALAERDGADVLHGARIEVGHDDLVVLSEWVGDTEVVLKEIEALTGWNEPVLRIDGVRDGCPREEPQGDFAGRRLPAPIVAGVQRVDIGTDPGRRRKRPGSTVAEVRNIRLGDDRDDLPVRRHCHTRLNSGLQVGLIE